LSSIKGRGSNEREKGKKATLEGAGGGRLGTVMGKRILGTVGLSGFEWVLGPRLKKARLMTLLHLTGST